MSGGRNPDTLRAEKFLFLVFQNDAFFFALLNFLEHNLHNGLVNRAPLTGA